MKSMILEAGLLALAGQASTLSCMFCDDATGYADAVKNSVDFKEGIGTLDWARPSQDTPMGGLMMEFEGQQHIAFAHFTGDVMEGGVDTIIDVQHGIDAGPRAANYLN